MAALLGSAAAAEVVLAAGPSVTIIQPDVHSPAATLRFAGITDTGSLTVTLSCDGLWTESGPIPYAATLDVSLAIPGCEGYGDRTVWVTVYDNGTIVLQQAYPVSFKPVLAIEMPLAAQTGHTFTFRPRYPSDYAAPSDAVCQYELRWGDTNALEHNEFDETFGALGFQAPVVDGNCQTWTFTLPWVPYAQFELYLTVGRVDGQSSEWWDDAHVRFPASVDGTNPRITASNLPIAQVLPSTYTPIVGQSITYTRYLIAGAKAGTDNRWTAWQGQGDHPNQWNQDGGATFTITPWEPGDVLVGWQRFSGSFLYAMFDPPVRYRDHDRPNTTPPVARLGGGQAGATVRASIAWTGTDRGWGIDRYQVDRSLDGGTWTRIASTRARSLALQLTPGHRYRYRVRAIDEYGNVGDWDAGPTFRATTVDDGAAAVHYAGSWQVLTDASAAGGSIHESGAPGASATYTFTGMAFAYVAERGRYHGQVRIYVDGSLLTTLDLESRVDMPPSIVVARSWTTAGKHTVRIEVVGTPRRPTVDLDEVLVLG